MDHAISTAGQPPATAAAEGPVVINLCASAAPIEFRGAGLPGLEHCRVYQVRRIEDSRPRYRLRLGFFPDTAAAEAILGAVRNVYPAAFSVRAGHDDLKFAPAFPAPARTPAIAPATVAVATRGTDAADPSTTAPVQTEVSLAPSTVPTPSLLELLPDPPVASTTSRAVGETLAAPFRVQAADPDFLGVTADLGLASVAADPSSLPLHLPAPLDEPVVLDSTQTLRLLTEAEIADDEGPQWFVVELTIDDDPIDIQALPQLDIFAAFRLYSVATPVQGRICHCLRLGFFKEAVSAEAVSGYLKTFYPAPNVVRVSAAEQTRFANPPSAPVLTDTAPASARVVPLHGGRTGAAVAPVLEVGRTAPRNPVKPAAVMPRTPAPGPASRETPPRKTLAATAVARKSAPTSPGSRPDPKRGLIARLVDRLGR